MPSAIRTTRGAAASAEDVASLSVRERLIFAQAVYEYGAKQSTWPEIAKLLSKHPLISRPKNFFTAQSCVVIYEHLMNEAGIKPTEAASGKKAKEHLQLAQRHYYSRIVNLKEDIVSVEHRFKHLLQEIEDIKAGKWDKKIVAQIKGESVVDDETPQTEKDDDSTEKVDEEVSMDISSPTVPSPSHEAERVTSVQIEDSTQETADRIDPTSPRADVRDVAGGEELSASPQQATGSTSGDGQDTADDGAHEDSHAEEPDTSAEELQSEKAETDDAGTPAQQSERPHTPREEETTDAASHESTPPPPARENKRRAPEVEGTISDTFRDRKRIREDSEPVEIDDADSPATPSAAPSGVRSTKERSRFQRVIYMLHAQISAHRNGTIFHHPIKPSEAPDYRDIVKRPMDLKTIKNRVRDGSISTSREYQRDIYLMLANSLMYNRPNSDIYVMAEEMVLDSEAHINNFQQTEVFNEARTRT